MTSPRTLLLAATLVVACALCLVAAAASPPPCDLLRACHDPASCSVLAESPPAQFALVWKTSRGAFVVDVTSAWAPPYAARLWQLARLQYFAGASFYRMLRRSATDAFVVQFGYRGDAAVDTCWDAAMTSNATWSVAAPGNVRGTLSFSMDAVAPADAHNPNCTSTSYCAQGFSTNVFINLADNSARLDPPGFSIVGRVRDAGMAVVDALYAGYGEVQDLCAPGATDRFCVGTGAQCAGVNMTRLVAEGNAYLQSERPLLDSVYGVDIL